MVVDVHMSDEVGRDTGYRTISGWAIAGLLLGILSAAAVVGPILWLIPVFAIVVSAIGLRQIKNSQGQMSGWSLAVLGLLLALFFGAAGPGPQHHAADLAGIAGRAICPSLRRSAGTKQAGRRARTHAAGLGAQAVHCRNARSVSQRSRGKKRLRRLSKAGTGAIPDFAGNRKPSRN